MPPRTNNVCRFMIWKGKTISKFGSREKLHGDYTEAVNEHSNNNNNKYDDNDERATSVVEVVVVKESTKEVSTECATATAASQRVSRRPWKRDGNGVRRYLRASHVSPTLMGCAGPMRMCSGGGDSYDVIRGGQHRELFCWLVRR